MVDEVEVVTERNEDKTNVLGTVLVNIVPLLVSVLVPVLVSVLVSALVHKVPSMGVLFTSCC